MLRGQPVVDRDDTAAAGVRQRARDAIVSLHGARHQPAAMEIHEAGQEFRGTRGRRDGRRVESDSEGPCRPRDVAIHHLTHRGAGSREVHEVRQRRAALADRDIERAPRIAGR
jgi:hypothetical protein